MPCTTILVGKKASYDGSTMIARNDDSPSGQFTPKKFVVVHPEEQPKKYKSVLSHVEIDLPEDPMRYTAVPNALDGEGIWAAHGVNAAGVGMTATETITSNARVLGADPLVEYVPAKDGVEEISGGIGEEDIVSLVLPYIHSAREGVTRLGSLLEKYGTYEMNGIAFSDKNEIWWLETIGGHHWIARRVPDDAYVVMPNQFGIDAFDLEDILTDNFGTHTVEDLGADAADTAKADYANGAVADFLGEHMLINNEVAFVSFARRVCQMSQEHHGMGNSQFGNGVRRITGNKCHLEAQFLGIGNIDMVLTNRSGQYILNTEFLVDIEILFVGKAVTTQDNSIKTFCHFSRFRSIQVIGDTFDVIPKSLIAALKNRFFNVSDAITQNLHDNTS